MRADFGLESFHKAHGRSPASALNQSIQKQHACQVSHLLQKAYEKFTPIRFALKFH